MILDKSWEACGLSDAELQLCLETGAVPGWMSLPYTMHPAIGGMLDVHVCTAVVHLQKAPWPQLLKPAGCHFTEGPVGLVATYLVSSLKGLQS